MRIGSRASTICGCCRASLPAGGRFAQDHHWIFDYVADAFADDLDKNKPPIVYVDDSDALYLTAMHVNLVAYFSENAHFRDAWGHYRYTQSVASCNHPESMHCNFDIYLRTP